MYLHQNICISPQLTHGTVNIKTIQQSVDGKLYAIEPTLEGVPPGMLRRMSKAVRMGIGAGLPLLQNNKIDGIVIGTANGGMEDCIKFLNQIVDYNEGLLTPANFVQSTPNAIAGQLSLISKNRSYNATHIHNGLAFENALLDTRMLIAENPGCNYLLGGVDEISTYNYNIDCHAGWYNTAKSNSDFYTYSSPATVAGEGAAMFIANNNKEHASAKVDAIEIFHSSDIEIVESRFKQFIAKHLPKTENTIFLSGDNDDIRFLPFYLITETSLGSAIPIARFKHISGDYPTVSSFALWLACYAFKHQMLPRHFYKNEHSLTQIDRIVMYNQFQGSQHSFVLLSR